MNIYIYLTNKNFYYGKNKLLYEALVLLNLINILFKLFII